MQTHTLNALVVKIICTESCEFLLLTFAPSPFMMINHEFLPSYKIHLIGKAIKSYNFKIPRSGYARGWSHRRSGESQNWGKGEQQSSMPCE